MQPIWALELALNSITDSLSDEAKTIVALSIFKLKMSVVAMYLMTEPIGICGTPTSEPPTAVVFTLVSFEIPNSWPLQKLIIARRLLSIWSRV